MRKRVYQHLGLTSRLISPQNAQLLLDMERRRVFAWKAWADQQMTHCNRLAMHLEKHLQGSLPQAGLSNGLWPQLLVMLMLLMGIILSAIPACAWFFVWWRSPAQPDMEALLREHLAKVQVPYGLLCRRAGPLVVPGLEIPGPDVGSGTRLRRCAHGDAFSPSQVRAWKKLINALQHYT